MLIEELSEKYINFLSEILSERWELDDPTTKPGEAFNYINRWIKNIDNSICYIGIVDNMPIGYAVFDPYNELYEKLTPWCLSLWVHENYRGKGYGYLFTQKRFEYAKNLGYTNIYLDTLQAKDYHLKFGWDIIDTITYKRNDSDYNKPLYIMKHKL